MKNKTTDAKTETKRPQPPSTSRILLVAGATFAIGFVTGNIFKGKTSDKPIDVVTDQEVNTYFVENLQDPDSKLFQKALAAEPNIAGFEKLSGAFNEGKQKYIDRLEAEKTAVEESMGR